MKDSVLYYPSIEINNEEWLKSTLLVWDRVYRIVPRNYEPQDSDDIKRAVDSDLIRSIYLDSDDLKGAVGDFEKFMASVPYTPAGLEDSDISFVHPDKVDASLYPLLDKFSRGLDSEVWIQLPREVARGYMYFLAQNVAEHRLLERCTDRPDNFAIGSYFSELANFKEEVYDEKASGFYSSLMMTDLLPKNLSQVSMEKIINVVNRSHDEKLAFRSELVDFADQFHRCESPEHARLIYTDYKNKLMQAKGNLKKSQGFLKKGGVGSLFTMGLPTSMTALGAASLAGDPFSITAISSSLLIGAVASYSDYAKTKSVKENPCGASYMISLDKAFSGRDRFPAFDRHLEEFIND